MHVSRRFYTFICAFLCCAASLSAQTNNLLGMDASYVCLGDKRYEITVNVYRDCNGAPINGPQIISNNFEFLAPANCLQPVGEGSWQTVAGSGQEISLYCPSEITQCASAGSANPGVQKYTFKRVYRFNGMNCDVYTLKLASFSRSLSLTNATITAAAPTALYQASSKIDLSLAACNGTPVITSRDVVRICQNQPYVYNPGAIDPDGDKLVYRLGDCLGGDVSNPSAVLPYIAGKSGSNPIGSAPGAVIDANTGDLSITPNGIETAAICIYIDEVRNGIVINTTVQDITVVTTDCAGNANPTLSPFANSGNYNQDLCTGGILQDTIYASDIDAAQILTATFNNGFPGAVITPLPQTVSPSGAIVVPIAISWAPTIDQVRAEPYQLVVRARDNHCPTTGSVYESYQITVNFSSLSVGDFVTTNCTEAAFNADIQFGQPPYTVLWEGAGGLTANPNANQTNFTHTYPAGTGVYPYKLTVTDATGCYNTQLGTVNITKPSVDTNVSVSQNTVCVTDSVTYNYFGAEVNPTISWNFGLFASPASAVGPGPFVVKYNLPGTKTINISVSNQGCTQSTTQTVEVTPAPLIGAGPDLYICKGAGEQLQGTANVPTAGCAIVWTPTDYLSNPNSLTPFANPVSDMTYYLQLVCGGACVSNIDTVRVYVRPRPLISVMDEELNYCLGQQPALLQASGIGGVGQLAYLWQPAAGINDISSPTPEATPAVTTLYTVYVTDQNGCQSPPAFVLVEADSVPVANAGPDVFLCPGQPGKMLAGSANFGGFGSFDYEWFPKEGLSNPFIKNPIATPDTTTIYTLVVKDQESGCKSVVSTLDSLQTVTVYVSIPPVDLAGPDVSICQGTSTVLGLIPTGGGPVYTYEWLPTAGLDNPAKDRPTATPDQTTTYYLWVSSNGCRSFADSVTVTIIPFPTANINGPVEVCPTDSVQLETQIFGATGNFTFRWSPDNGTLSDIHAQSPKASPKVTTTYSFYVTTESCDEQFVESVLVQVRPMPTIDADPVNDPVKLTICAGNPIKLPAIVQSGSPFTIRWSPGGSLSDSTIAQPMASPLESTTYTLYVTQGLCTLTDTIRIAVKPFLPVDIAVDTTIICLGDKLTLYGNGGLGSAAFSWSGSAEGADFATTNEITIQPTAVGDYTYTFKVVEGGCENEKTVIIKVLNTPQPKFRFTFPEGCAGLTVSFQDESVDVVDRIWDFGDGTIVVNELSPVHTYTKAGVFNVTLTTSIGEGCGDRVKGRATVRVAEAIDADFTSVPPATETIYVGNSNVQFSDNSPGAVSWFWNFGDSTVSTEQNPNHVYYVAGNFNVKLTVADENGCLFYVEKRYRVELPELKIPNVFTPNGDGVNDFWKITYTGARSFDLSVFDRFGILLYQTNNPQAQGWNGLNANNAEMQSGVYFYRLKVGERDYDGQVTLLR